MLFSIDRRLKLFSLQYKDISKIVCYPSSIILSIFEDVNKIKDDNDNGNDTDNESEEHKKIKLKTTSSFCIRELLNYYNNYNDISKKMKDD
jgi:hypothetical protein